ncbi:MAG: SCO1664 family protein [Haloechinothrix sp.]
MGEGTDVLQLITHGRLEVEGRLLDASNATLYCAIELDGMSANAVYKPIAGERPLWDFPRGTLAGREVATYLIADAAELGAIPPTMIREGPLGPGMVQLWIEASSDELVDIMRPEQVPDGWHQVLVAHDRFGEPAVLAHADRTDVQDLALLDVVINNTDRKGGHVLHGLDGRAYGVDHGICLHFDPKLRTVLWGWAGTPVPGDGIEKLRKLRADVDGQLGETLSAHLTSAEVRAVGDRISRLIRSGVFPAPSDYVRSIPWPPI